ncbi:hypothetical protein ACVWW4_000126 [Bradyrhizobium sp. LB7.1]
MWAKSNIGLTQAQSKELVITEVKYDDNIHTAVNGWTSFPEQMIKSYMMRGISRIYDDVLNSRLKASAIPADDWKCI